MRGDKLNLKSLFLNFLFVALAQTCLPLNQAHGAGPLSADQIVMKADDGRIPPGSVTFLSRVVDLESGATVRESVYKVYNRGKDKSLVETLQPERQKGRKLLMDGENLWFSTPETKRPARVSMQQRLTGEVANGDMARTNYSGDYNATLTGRETVGGQETYRLALQAKHKGVTYSKIDYWVTVKGLLPAKAVFYAVSGKVLKTGEFSAPKRVLGRTCMTRTEFTDAIDKTRKSVLIFSEIKRAAIPDSMFTKESLSE